MAPSHTQPTEFKTVDGITLRGTLYPAASRGPGIVLTPGFNCVKEMFVPPVASYFQSKGITALIYDPRSTGLSDGMPRNDIDPIKQAEDYFDALTFLMEQPTVDPSQVAYWGMSFSGAVTLSAASMDKRAKAAIVVCPLTNFECTPEKMPKVMAKAMKDRASQLKGNSPFYLPMVTEKGENPAGFGVGLDQEKYSMLVNAGTELAPNHVNRTTIQTYYRMVMWQPFGLWKAHLAPTPVFLIVPELDQLSPVERQLARFEEWSGPKRCHIEMGRGHMDILEGDGFERLMERQVEFLRDALAGKVQKETLPC